MLGGGSLCGFGEALELTARFPEPSLLARIRMAVELGRLAHADGCDELLERLSDATDASWPAPRLALIDLRRSELAAGV
jgi:hypothetical protein